VSSTKHNLSKSSSRPGLADRQQTSARRSTSNSKNNNQNNQRDNGSGNEEEAALDNVREFLSYLEKKNIINIAEVVQNKTQINALIQDIMKLDLEKFNKSRAASNIGGQSQLNKSNQSVSQISHVSQKSGHRQSSK